MTSKFPSKLFLFCIWLTCWASLCVNASDGSSLAADPLVSSAVYATFDDLPPTGPNDSPGDSADWIYTTAGIHPDTTYPMTNYDWAGWRKSVGYASPNGNIRNFFYLYLNTYNSSHMGFSTYGYLEIDDLVAVQGNSLRYTVTGGINESGTFGLPVTTKEQFLSYQNAGNDPVAQGVVVGHPYLYFANNSPSSSPIPLPEAQGANRLSMYYFAPATLTNGTGGSKNRPEITMHLGPFNGTGGHWYHEICNQGGGWTHVLADAHPQHNNAWSSASLYPYPSSSLRDMGIAYFNSWYRWYITFKPHAGIGQIPYSVWYDEVEFRTDSEPQNSETICSPAVTWFPASRTFEIGFMDKYKNNQYSYSTYEVRYAFDPITNSTWNDATPVHILADSRFGINERTDGKFQKWSPYYNSVWAPFTLSSTQDLNRLTAGTVIHFAIRDISQINGDSLHPVTNSGIGHWTVDGRDYANHGNTFDYAGDRTALPLIKRIDYEIPKEPPSGFGSLTVTILPQPAATAGGQWRRVGTESWLNSGETETRLPVGDYFVEFRTISGWETPATQTIAVTDGGTARLEATYLQIPDMKVYTIAGNGQDSFSGDGGPAIQSTLSFPYDVAVDATGCIYISDSGNARIRKVNLSGIITTIVGTGAEDYSGDGGPATQATLNTPFGIHVDSSGNLYIADTFNHAIRKVNQAGIISTVAGNGSSGYSGDGGSAKTAQLNKPSAIVTDHNGNLYIADTDNNIIRIVNVSGMISTIAGNRTYGYSGDNGPALNASFRHPMGLDLDANGNLYVADIGNSVIRRITPNGIISTVAGSGTEGYSGNGGPAVQAQLFNPSDIMLDPTGNLYIADSANQVVRLVDTAGRIRTIIGTGESGFSGDGGPAEQAQFTNMTGLAMNAGGQIYIADLNNQRIRLVTLPVQADAGTDRTTFVGRVVQLNGVGTGGSGRYTYSWTILSGPDSDSGQFSSTTKADPLFAPSSAGVYEIRFVVDDGLQPAVSDTLTILAIAVNSRYSVVVTDTVNTYIDLSSGTDYDPTDARQLIIRWNLDPGAVRLTDIQDVHVYVRVNSTGEYEYLGNAGSSTAIHFEWKSGLTSVVNPRFQSGPVFGEIYQFRIFVLTRSGSPFFYGPYDNAGPIRFLEEIPPTPTPISTSTRTYTPTPTAQSSATNTPTTTVTRTLTSTPTRTATFTATPTRFSPTPTPTPTAPHTETNTPTVSPTGTSTASPTRTITPTSTPTQRPSATNTPTTRPSPALTVTPTSTPSRTPTPFAPVELTINGAAISGQLIQPADQKWYWFRTSNTGTHVIQTSSVSGQSSADTVIHLYGPDSVLQLIASDDDSGESLFSQICIPLQTGHLFYVLVAGSGGSVGGYSISVRHVVPTPTATPTPTITPTPTPTTPVGTPIIRIEPLSLEFVRMVTDTAQPVNLAKRIKAADLRQIDYTIFLGNGTIETNSGSASAPAAAHPGRGHFLIQFENIPTEADKDLLASQGIHLLNYVPNMAYWASVTREFTGVTLQSVQPAIRWNRPSSQINKLASDVEWNIFPLNARLRDGRVLVHAVIFPDVSHENAEEVVGKIGVEFRKWVDPLVFEASIAPADLRRLAALDCIEWVQTAPSPYHAMNAVAAQRANVPPLYSLPYELTGKDVLVGVWDAGAIDLSHQDFGTRLQVMNQVSTHSHATHVGGTIGGAGKGSALAKGMAPAVSLRSYDWTNDTSEMRSAASGGTRLSNHSYDYIVGWYWDGSKWVDYGNSYKFGSYSSVTRDYDSVVYDTGLSVFKSAGNDRNEGPSGSQDGPYDCIPPIANAKNIVTVGATDDADFMSLFSSWGPTDDGRVKPDLCANGVSLYSTLPGGNYGSYSGTSMSSPSACGASALLHQLFQRAFGRSPSATTLKALLIHGAKDLGRVGPDYEYGWGLIDTEKSAGLLSQQQWREGSVSTGDYIPYHVSATGDLQEFKATLVWTDYPGTVSAGKSLINDLDLIVRSPSGVVYRPWILDKTNPTANAGAGINTVDNVEQVRVLAPQEGLWTIEVHGSAIPQGPSGFTVVSEAFGSSTDHSSSFKIYNDGDAPLNVQSIGVANAPWVVWSPLAPFTVDPGSQRDVTVTVNFDQAPQGASSARLLIHSNDPDPNHSPYPEGVYISANNNAPTPTPSPTKTPTPTATPTIPIVPEIHIDPLTLSLTYVQQDSPKASEKRASGHSESPAVDNIDFNSSEMLPDGRVLVWARITLGTDLAMLRSAIEMGHGEILSLSPEGRLLVAVLPVFLNQLLQLPGFEEVVPAPPKTDSLPETPPIDNPGLGATPPTDNDLAMLHSQFTQVDFVAPNDLSVLRAELSGNAVLAEAVDNTISQYFPPIRSQGGQGSCTCWASAYYYNTYTQARDENVNVSNGDNSNICSPGFLYPLVNGGYDGGAYTGYAISRLSTIGCTSWAIMPYSDSDYTTWPSEQAWVDALSRRTAQNNYIYVSSETTLQALKQHLANGNIAVTQCPVYTNWYQWRDNQNRGIQNGVLYSHTGEALVGYHAMTIVGYDDHRPYSDGTQDREGAVLIANSWGTWWGTYNSTGTGTRGYMWVSYDYFMQQFRYVYYNTDRDNYRPLLYAVTGINSSSRQNVYYGGGVGTTDAPAWTSGEAIDGANTKPYGGPSHPIDDQRRVAVDLTDGIASADDPSNVPLFVRLRMYGTVAGTITSADFYHDMDGDGEYTVVSSEDPTISIGGGAAGYATADLNWTNNTASFVVYNQGSGNLSVNSISADTPLAWIDWSHHEPFVISPGDSERIHVTVNWDEAPLGHSSLRLLVGSNDSDENPYPAGVYVFVNKNATPTPTATITPTRTVTPTPTRTFTKTATPTATRTPTGTRTPTITPTFTPSRTPVPSSTPTRTKTPTSTATYTRTPTATRTYTPSPTYTVTPTGTVTPTASPTRTFTVTPTVPPSFTPTRTYTRTATPTVTLTPTRTYSPTGTPSPAPTSTPTPTFTVTPTPILYDEHILFGFDSLSSNLASLGFQVIPQSIDAEISAVPKGQTEPLPTNGVGIRVVVPAQEFVTLNGPPIRISSEPIRIAVWYYASEPDLHVGLGAFTNIQGRSGPASFTIRGGVEVTAGIWQKTEIEIEALYTQVNPFLVVYNANVTTQGTLYFDNLSVDQGDAVDPGTAIIGLDWVANLWLPEEDHGEATIDGNHLVLEKSTGEGATRFVGSYTTSNYPNITTIETEIVKDYGESGIFTLWAGNGPSAFQTYIPLWILPNNEPFTMRLAGNTAQNSGSMYVVVQISGEDDERCTINSIEVHERISD